MIGGTLDDEKGPSFPQSKSLGRADGGPFIQAVLDILLQEVMVTTVAKENIPFAEQVKSTREKRDLVATYAEGTKLIYHQLLTQSDRPAHGYGLSFAVQQEQWEASFAELTGLPIVGTNTE
jgi:hypothetical protein